MKKKVLSLLLAVCLIVGMLPLAASAAETPVEAETIGIAPANLVDADGVETLYGSYSVTATQDAEANSVTVKVLAEGLKKHAMTGEEEEDVPAKTTAYWCGFSLIPTGDKAGDVQQMKVVSGTSVDDVNTKFETASAMPVWQNVTADGESGLVRYYDAKSDTKVRYYKLQWLGAGGAEIAEYKPTTYTIDISGVQTADETKVLPGKLHDTREEEEGGLADNELYTDYDVTSVQKMDVDCGGYYTEVSVAAKDLKEHQNGNTPQTMGYWAGMFAVAPEGAAKYKYASGTSYSDLKTASMSASPSLDEMPDPDGEGNVQGIGVYVNINKPGYKTWLKVQWLDASGKALDTTVYRMDFSNSTVSSDDDAPEYKTEIATGVLEDHSGAVAKNQIAAGYTLTKGEMVKDTATGQYYQEVTVSADTLKPQKNTQNEVGYWLGFAATPGADIGEVAKMKYGFASSLSALSLSNAISLESAVIGEKAGIAFYANMNDYDTRTLWARVQWLKDGSTVLEENYYKINFQVNTKETVGIKDIAVYKSGAISDTVSAALGEDGKTITLSGVAPGSDTTYTLKYTTTAGGAGETDVTYHSNDSSITTDEPFKVLDTVYTVKADFTTLENVKIATGDTAITMPGIAPGDKDDVEAALKDAEATGLEALTVDVAEDVNAIRDIETTAKEQLKEEIGSVTGDVNIFVQPYLNIEATGYNKVDGTLALNITAKYQTVATTATVADDIELGATGKNAVLLDVEGASGDLTVKTPVKVDIKLPTGFVSTNAPIYVLHKGEHYHKADVTSTGGTYTATFTTEGFSPFVFDTKAAPEASIDGFHYATLQDAVNAVQDGGFITIDPSASASASATVSKEITFTTNVEVDIWNDANHKVEVTENGGGTFTYKSTRVGSSGGGTGSTGYTVTVSATQNGTVTASPSSAAKGDKVTLTVAPAEGYELGTLTAKDAKGNTVALTKVSDTKYTFTMPEGNVTVSATFVEKNATPFTDVKTADWWYEAVKYVYENKLMSGTSATTFGPTAKLNRAQAVQILYNLEGQPAVTGTADFTDVSGHWALNAITWGAKNGVVAGVGNGKFDPNAEVTREQFAQMMYNYAKSKGYDLSAAGDLDKFSDVSKVSGWAVAALTWANGEGLINGNTDGTVNPLGTAIRGEAASIMAKFDQNVVA